MSGSQRYRAAHKGTGRQTNDTGRRTKGIEGNRNELNAVHIQLCQAYFLPSSGLDKYAKNTYRRFITLFRKNTQELPFSTFPSTLKRGGGNSNILISQKNLSVDLP